MEIHHVGYLVKNIEKALNSFVLLGYMIETKTVQDNDRQAYMAMIRMGKTRVELIQPYKGSPLEELLKRYNNAPYHICYKCSNIDQMQEQLTKNGFFLLQKSEPAILLDNKKVCFMVNRDIGMIELVENEDES